MHATADRLEFAPPPAPGMLRAVVLAIIAHLLLMLALTWGVNWKREAENVAAEAELWSSVPQQAAPKLIETPPPMPEPPKPEPVVKITPPPKPEPLPRQADIALEQEKKKQAELKAKQLSLEKQKLEEQKKLELAKKKAAEDKQRQELVAAKSKQQDEVKRIDAQRQANLDRMKGLAGATGAPTSAGTAMRSSGMSDSYAGRIRARVKPNIVFTEDIAGNPMTDIEVRTSPDGTIVGQRILKSSGVRGWDDAVLKAIIKTEVLPRDVDGRVHSPLIISFRPKDL